MLTKFRAAKQQEITALAAMKLTGNFPPPLPAREQEKLPGFVAALKRECRHNCAIIAEYKRASPSRGAINLLASPARTALAYAGAGAAALSVLTEETYFKGSLDYLYEMRGESLPGGLAHNLPLLRKDFIFHPLQVKATAATPASALLLIARMLDLAGLAELLSLAATFGLECVVEVFDQTDLQLARLARAEIIQVNNRDLATLHTDLTRSFQLVEQKQDHETWISASGISRPEELAKLHAAGFDAALVGSYLMAAAEEDLDPGAALGILRGGHA